MFGREEKVPILRLAVAQYVILAVFLLLVYGLWRLQVMQSDRYSNMADQNRIKEVPILAPRGKLLDREGRAIVDNYPSFSALLLRSQGPISEANLDAIALGLHLDAAELKARVQRLSSMPGYQPIFLKFDITPDELAFIESHRNEYPELDTITVHRRLYPKNGFMAHLIGYVGEVSEEMLNQPRFELYNAGDVVGQSGIEAEYNDMLMGKNGSRRVLVNSKGKEVGELSDTPAIPGKPLQLTIDLDLQIAAEEALGDRPGAIIAMDPRSGEILAMVSRPTFDPNSFAVHISGKEWAALLNDPGKPLLNKAIQAQLAPGSVFKVIMSVAGLQEKAISPEQKVVCNGGAEFYGHFFKCDRHHGPVNMAQAISVSCDTYFYTLGSRLGITRIAQWATAFGLGQKTGVDLPQEVTGIMPSEAWKIKTQKQKWYAGETISVSIGQGAVAVTPIQLARAIGAITSDGLMRTPHTVRPESLPAQYVNAMHLNDSHTVPIDPDTWNLITDAMADVTTTGTAAQAHLPGIDFAGKTGTAQTISLEARKRMGSSGKAFDDNAWFVGVTPRRNPEIVVAVLSQGAGWGWRSGIVASKIVKVYVDKKAAHDAGRPYTLPKIEPVTPGADSGEAPSAAPATPPATKPPATGNNTAALRMGGIWSDPEGHLHSGYFSLRGITVARHSAPFHPAVAAPGMEAFAAAASSARASNSPPSRAPSNKNTPHWTPTLATLPAPGWRLRGEQ
jgi:penicillin-binding protein 2